jgi:hypothetical protein
MTADLRELRYCVVCDRDRLFEQPPCGDGHGADCPDRACTACGTGATLVDQPGSESRIAA